MEKNATIIQLVYNIKTLKWQLDIDINGINTHLEISAIDAQNVINSFQLVGSNIIDIETNGDIIYYMPLKKR